MVQGDGRDVRELLVWICVGCFDGVIRFPLVRDGEWRDQGVDFFADQPTTRKAHECSGEQYVEEERALLRATFPAGNWHQEVLRLPQELYDRITASPDVSAGPAAIDPNP